MPGKNLIYSKADSILFEVDRIRAEDGNWEPDPECAEKDAEFIT